MRLQAVQLEAAGRGCVMAGFENHHDVLQQMEQFGVVLRDKDLQSFPKHLAKRVTCGAAGKDWYKLYEFTPRTGGLYLTGSFGTYRQGGAFQKVENDWAPLGQAERERQNAERATARDRATEQRAAEVANAAKSALEIWRQAVPSGASPYLERKGLAGESCRFLREQMVLRWPGSAPGEDDTVVRLPGGTLVLPLLRFDWPREQALRGLQFIRPDGAKIYLRGFDKPRCAVRLGEVRADTTLALVCEGYATGLTLRLGVQMGLPVFVAFDAGNLAHVVPMLRDLYPSLRLLICADDDFKTKDPRTGALSNPGRTTARKVARATDRCDLVWPVFAAGTRDSKDTDFDDLRQREGLDAVRGQLQGVINMIGRIRG